MSVDWEQAVTVKSSISLLRLEARQWRVSGKSRGKHASGDLGKQEGRERGAAAYCLPAATTETAKLAQVSPQPQIEPGVCPAPPLRF